jgi:hypothetical protein
LPKHSALTLLVALSLIAQAALRGAAPTALADAHEAWDRGDYPVALKAYIDIVSGPQGDGALEEIALQTGELYRTRELTTDGRAPRFSPDGRFIAYETGLEISRATRVIPSAGSGAAIGLPGVSATFSFDGRSAAYLRLGDAPDLAAAVRALDEAPLADQNRGGLIQALNYQVQRNATITVRNLATGEERPLDAPPGLLKTGLAFGADNRTVYFLGADENDPLKNDIYSVAEGRAPHSCQHGRGIEGRAHRGPDRGRVALHGSDREPVTAPDAARPNASRRFRRRPQCQSAVRCRRNLEWNDASARRLLADAVCRWTNACLHCQPPRRRVHRHGRHAPR